MKIRWSSILILLFLVLLIQTVSAIDKAHVVISDDRNFIFMENDGAAIPAPNTIGEDPTQDNLQCSCYGTGC